MSARFLSCCPDGQPLGPSSDHLPFVPDGKVQIVQPAYMTYDVWSGREKTPTFFRRMHYRQASMMEFWDAFREGRVEWKFGFNVPIVCLGSIWHHPITGIERVPYLPFASDPLNPTNWRMRMRYREFDHYWYYAVCQEPIGYCDVDGG